MNTSFKIGDMVWAHDYRPTSSHWKAVAVICVLGTCNYHKYCWRGLRKTHQSQLRSRIQTDEPVNWFCSAYNWYFCPILLSLKLILLSNSAQPKIDTSVQFCSAYNWYFCPILLSLQLILLSNSAQPTINTSILGKADDPVIQMCWFHHWW